MTRVYNKTSEKGLRRHLRQELPRAEVLLWSRLRNRQLANLKFRRQYSVGRFVVDFYCPAAKLAVEVDGDTHFGDGAEMRDVKRQAFMESFDIAFIRCTNEDVYQRIDGVLQEIERVALSRTDKKDPP